MAKVAQKVAQQARKQIGKITEGVFETAKKTPGEMAGVALEQLGITAGQKPTGPVDEKVKLAQREKRDQALAQQRIREIEAGIEKWRRLREEQLRRRREQMEQARAVAQQEAVSGALPTGGKPKRGSLFLRRQKGKTEMAASKRSG